MKHNEQRVLVLFDVQNLYYSAKHYYDTKVDFKEILKTAVSGRRLVRAIAYVIKTDIKDEVNFHDALNKIGIEVKAKDLQVFFGGAKKGDWDIGIAMDAVRLSNKVDTVVLVSGDGDFAELLRYLKSHGCRTEVIAFGKTSSKHIKDEADDYCDLGNDLNKYLINKKKQGGYKKDGRNVKNQPNQFKLNKPPKLLPSQQSMTVEKFDHQKYQSTEKSDYQKSDGAEKSEKKGSNKQDQTKTNKQDQTKTNKQDQTKSDKPKNSKSDNSDKNESSKPAGSNKPGSGQKPDQSRRHPSSQKPDHGRRPSSPQKPNTDKKPSNSQKPIRVPKKRPIIKQQPPKLNMGEFQRDKLDPIQEAIMKANLDQL